MVLPVRLRPRSCRAIGMFTIFRIHVGVGAPPIVMRRTGRLGDPESSTKSAKALGPNKSLNRTQTMHRRLPFGKGQES